MTLPDILARLEHIEHTSVWAHCPECKEEVRVDYSEMREAIAALRLDLERHLLRTEGTLT